MSKILNYIKSKINEIKNSKNKSAYENYKNYMSKEDFDYLIKHK